MTWFPAPENITSLVDIFKYANEATGNAYVPLMFFASNVVIYIVTYEGRQDPAVAFAVTTFLASIFSLFLWLLGLLPQHIFTICAILAVIGFLLLWR